MSKIPTSPVSEPKESEKQKRIWYQPNFNLATALTIIIGLACMIVAVGYLLYWNNSDHKYDIIRPGDKDENQVLSVEDSANDKTSPVDAAAVKKKMDNLTKETKALSGFSRFEPSDLSDQSLQIVPTEKPAY